MALKGIVRSTDYIFSAANKTITFSNDYIGMGLSDITYITNIKSGIATVIYDPFEVTKGGTLNGLTLTLAFNTTTMSDSDPLQIIVGFTPINPEPAPVKIVPQSNDVDQTQLLQNIADDLDLISLAMDEGERAPLNVKETGIKKDQLGAIVLSDAPEPITITLRGDVLNNTSNVIDTIGYLSTSITLKVPSTWGTTFAIEGSNDKNAWFYIPNTYSFNTSNFSSIGIFNIGTNVEFNLHIPNIYRFIRFRVTVAGAGALILSGIAFLRQYPITSQNPSGNLAVVVNNTPNTNISSIGGNATLGYSTTDTGPTSPSTLQAALGSGAVSGASNAPNLASSLSTVVPYPIGIGARENPYIGKLSGVFRHVTVDGGGKFVLGGDTPVTSTAYQSTKADGSIPGLSPRGIGGIPNNMVGAQNLTITDTSQVEGDTNTMLLKQILQELKILNQQLIEVPFLLNNGESTMSDPQEYRNDNSNLF